MDGSVVLKLLLLLESWEGSKIGWGCWRMYWGRYLV